MKIDNNHETRNYVQISVLSVIQIFLSQLPIFNCKQMTLLAKLIMIKYLLTFSYIPVSMSYMILYLEKLAC